MIEFGEIGANPFDGSDHCKMVDYRLLESLGLMLQIVHIHQSEGDSTEVAI